MTARRLILCGVSAIAVACRASSPPPAAPAPASGSGPLVRTSVRIGETFIPKTGDSAVRAFVPDVPAEETGGECSLLHTGGSGATIVIAYYPSRARPRMQVTVTFDSARRLVRYSERRGIPHIPSTAGMTPAQRDSVARAADASMRSTTISLDYAIDQAIASNRGGGQPTNAVLSNVRTAEQLDNLGRPAARLERMRKLCGV